MMSKIKYLGLLSLLGMIALPITDVQAAQYHEPISVGEMVNDSFEGLDETDLVLEMPEGGFLYGEAIEYSTDDPNTVIANYNSETDPNSVTVAEAKAILKEDAAIKEHEVEVYGATPPTADRLRQLPYGSRYVSTIFTGNGWRFADVQWKAGPNSGGEYLRWSSLVDGGRVGSYGEAYATYTGSLQGTAINVNSWVWNTEYGQGQIYYTFNPISGTQYVVENID